MAPKIDRLDIRIDDDGLRAVLPDDSWLVLRMDDGRYWIEHNWTGERTVKVLMAAQSRCAYLYDGTKVVIDDSDGLRPVLRREDQLILRPAIGGVYAAPFE